MPRAFDRGIPEVDKNPLRYGADYNDPEGIIGQGATEAAFGLGSIARQFLALDMLEEAFGEFVGTFTEIDWLSPEAIRVAIAATGKIIADIGRWFIQVFQNLTRIDLSENSQFIADLVNLLAFNDLYAAWEAFSTGWAALDWSNPLAAIHPAWMLVVDFFWGIAGWLGQIIRNILGINLPGFLAFDTLRSIWTTFFNVWSQISWSNPIAAITTAWRALVDLIWALWGWFKQVLSNLTGITLPDFFDLGTIKDLWWTFTDAWADITWTSIGAIWSALVAIGRFLRGAVHWAIGVFENLTGIDLEAIAASFGIGTLADALIAWADTLAGINWLSAGALMTAIGAFITLFQSLGNWLLGLIDSWLGWSTSVVGGMFSSVGNFIAGVVEYFWGATGLASWIKAIEKAAGFVGAGIIDAITGAWTEITRLGSLIGSFLNLQGLVDFIASILGETGLLGWLATLPFIGPLVSALTGIQPNTGTALDFSSLGIWAQGLLNGSSPIPGGNIVGAISDAILSTIPVAHISDASPNLLSQGNFNNDITVADGDGWEWDGTTTATGTGGSAKLTASGSLQALYSRQAVKVNAGDRITVSCRVKTTGFTAAAGRSMVLSIIPWTLVGGVMTQQSTVTIATRTTAAATFQSMTGSVYTVPTGVVRVQLRLAATANTGAVIWFDDASISKGGYLGQNLVDSLIAAWNDLFGGLTNPVVGAGATTGKTWNDLFSGASAFRSSYNTEASRGDTLRLNLFGSPTTVGSQIGLGAVPDIPRTKSLDMQSIINGIFRGLRGPRSEDSTAEEVYEAAYSTQESVAKVKAQVADLQSKAAAGTFSGVAIAVDFSTLAAASTLPSPWQNTYPSSSYTGYTVSGSGSLGITSGRAGWVTSTLDNRRAIAIYGTATNTNYQLVTAVFATMANSNAPNYIYGRSNLTGTTAVYARFTLIACELWAVTGSTHTRMAVDSGGFIGYQGTYKLECGVGATERRFRVWQDNKVIIDHTDGSTSTVGNLYTGLAADARTYVFGGQTRQALPVQIAAFSFNDNTPAAVLGSGLRIGRTSTATVTASATVGGAMPLPASFFGTTPDFATADLTYTAADNKVTASVSGWYLVTVAVRRVPWADTRQVFSSAILLNGAEYAIGHQQWGVDVATATANFTGNRGSSVVSIPVYLTKDQYVQAAYVARNSTEITGNTSGSESYFSVVFMNNTKPVQPAA